METGLPQNRASWVTVTTIDKRTGREVSEEQIALAPMKGLDETAPELLRKKEKLPEELETYSGLL